MKSGESFDFKEGYETTAYEVHKQYNLRSRRIDIPDDPKKKTIKQPTKTKPKDPHIPIIPKSTSHPNSPAVEDVADKYKSEQHPTSVSPLREIVEEPLEDGEQVTPVHHNIPVKEAVVENLVEKHNLATQNVKIQTEKTFNMEAEISKFKVSIPLSELARHEVFR